VMICPHCREKIKVVIKKKFEVTVYPMETENKDVSY